MTALNKLRQTYHNAHTAYIQLEGYIGEFSGRKIEKAGTIQGFEFTFEAIWHLFQKIVEANGGSAPFPRLAIAGAFQMRLIDDEAQWLAMLKDRNLTSHSYNQSVADKIFENVRSSYQGLFRDALRAVDQWLTAHAF